MWKLILLVLAIICFALRAFDVDLAHLHLTYIGLALFATSFLPWNN